jgi:hypothetical protein
MKTIIVFWAMLLSPLSALVCQENTVDFPVLHGPYLGQKPPDQTPEVFAPGIVSTGLYTRDIAITPDGREIYFCVVLANYTFATILSTREEDGRWTEPEVMRHMEDTRFINLEPCISPDGKRFFFLSNRPETSNGETEGDEDIWVMDRAGNGWGEPYNLGAPVNTEDLEFFPSVTLDGTLYFTRAEKGSRMNAIFRSRFSDGRYQTPERLPVQVNCGQSQFNAFVAPNESYVIVPVNGRKDSFGGTDYYAVYRNPDDTWSEPVNLGSPVNTAGGLEYSPAVSPDGKYFFFMSGRVIEKEKWPKELSHSFLKALHGMPGNGNPSIYWMDVKIIEDKRPVK